MAPTQKPKGTFAKLMSSTPPSPSNLVSKETTEQKAGEPLHDTVIPRHHDTTVARNHDTTTQFIQDDIFEVVRKAVKQIGKEAATHRFTVDEKTSLQKLNIPINGEGYVPVKTKLPALRLIILSKITDSMEKRVSSPKL